eukprot:TRINITY_DN674_c0_g1_i1.p1 TRINITY_DN674_c0_g1~~TRINITY_DN674_c0_g1_i1.p1  ORF type:complete len:662 (+),score=161.14 TRINITY_DN674_c0_g1_i1:62-2047(+)
MRALLPLGLAALCACPAAADMMLVAEATGAPAMRCTAPSHGRRAACGDVVRAESSALFLQISVGSCADACAPADGRCGSGKVHVRHVFGECTGWARGTTHATYAWDPVTRPDVCEGGALFHFAVDIPVRGCVVDIEVESPAADAASMTFRYYAASLNTANELAYAQCPGLAAARARETVRCTAWAAHRGSHGVEFTTIQLHGRHPRAITWREDGESAPWGGAGGVWAPEQTPFALTFDYTLRPELEQDAFVLEYYVRFIDSGSVYHQPKHLTLMDPSSANETGVPRPSTDVPLPATDVPLPATDVPVPATGRPSLVTDAPSPSATPSHGDHEHHGHGHHEHDHGHHGHGHHGHGHGHHGHGHGHVHHEHGHGHHGHGHHHRHGGHRLRPPMLPPTRASRLVCNFEQLTCYVEARDAFGYVQMTPSDFVVSIFTSDCRMEDIQLMKTRLAAADGGDTRFALAFRHRPHSSCTGLAVRIHVNVTLAAGTLQDVIAAQVEQGTGAHGELAEAERRNATDVVRAMLEVQPLFHPDGSAQIEDMSWAASSCQDSDGHPAPLWFWLALAALVAAVVAAAACCVLCARPARCDTKERQLGRKASVLSKLSTPDKADASEYHDPLLDKGSSSSPVLGCPIPGDEGHMSALRAEDCADVDVVFHKTAEDA